LVPRVQSGRVTPQLAAFTVAGIFEAGIQDSDANLAFVALEDASELKGLKGAPEGLAVRLHDPLRVAAFRDANRSLIEAPDEPLRYSDWTVEHRNLFTAIHIEKTMMRIILMFIVAVAAFNIVASLMMVVIDKQKDIAILRTYGLEPSRVARVFLVQGSVIGLVGTVLGTALGLAVALNIDVIVPWLEATFRFKIMPGDIYYVTEIPSEVHLFDVVSIPVVALLVAVLATVYPARRAAAIAPAMALRYD
jgi:lipoprotein-releasing system permease protein